MEELVLRKRIKGQGHSARKDRRSGMIPGVIYGKEIGNELFDVNVTDLEKELAVSGQYGVLKFNLDGQKGTAVIKELQKNHFGNKVIHLDLEEISDKEKMTTEVGIKISGKGLLESKGLILQVQKDLVKVTCTAADLPKEFDLDVSEATAGTVYTLKDLNISENVTVDDDLGSVIGSVIVDEREEDDSEEESTEE
ncbi:MAG: 50S ribosomal protein L25 [Clostridium sp.]